MKNLTPRASSPAGLVVGVLWFWLCPGAMDALGENPASGELTTGETIEVIIDEPVDGSLVSDEDDLFVRGRTNIPEIPVSTLANILYVVDVSGSTASPAGQDCSGDSVVDGDDDFNGDGTIGDTLDCEISGVLALNRSLGDLPDFDGGVIPFGTSAAVADVSPDAGAQPFTSPLDTDSDGDLVPDLEEVVRSLDQGRVSVFQTLTVGTGTNFNAALTSAATALATQPAAEIDIVFLLSDGVGSLSRVPGSILDTLAQAGTVINTYSVGAGGSGCGPASNLEFIAQATRGNCLEVEDPSTLAAALTETTPRGIRQVEVALNGGEPVVASLNALGDWEAVVPASQLQGLGSSLLIEATVVATDETRVTADVMVDLLASCENLFGIGSRVVRGRSCDAILREANQLSTEANPPSLDSGPGRTRFSREETELFFDAAECRTGVPAPLLRAYSLEEALGVTYSDPYPRQFLEPCEQVWNRNGNINSIELWQRYYGVGCPVSRRQGQCVEIQDGLEPWPLLAIGSLDAGCDPTAAGCPSEPPSSGLGVSWCALFPNGDCHGSSFSCTGTPLGVGGTPPSPMPSAADWQEVAPALVHVTLGNDRPGRDTFGLGLGQVTFPIDKIGQFDRVTLVRDEVNYPGNGVPGPPFGGGVPFTGGLGIQPLDEDQMVAVIRDPQFNVLVAAELVAIKWQQITDTADEVTECRDADYGRIITLHEAPPFVGADQLTRDLWTCSVGSIKAGSTTCAGAGPQLVKNAIDFDPDPFQRIHRCFSTFINDRLASNCRRAQAFAFAYACNDLETYFEEGELPASDPCRSLIEEYERP